MNEENENKTLVVFKDPPYLVGFMIRSLPGIFCHVLGRSHETINSEDCEFVPKDEVLDSMVTWACILRVQLEFLNTLYTEICDKMLTVHFSSICDDQTVKALNGDISKLVIEELRRNFTMLSINAIEKYPCMGDEIIEKLTKIRYAIDDIEKVYVTKDTR